MLKDNSAETLVTELRAEVASRIPGDRLPSSRQLVERHHVSPITVSRALAALAAEGAVVVRPGAGTFVAAPPAQQEPGDLSWQSLALGERAISADALSQLLDPPHDSSAISLASGYPHPSLMPSRILATAWARAARLPDAFDRPPAEGILRLRAWFARSAAPGIEPRDVLITPGGQSAISAVVRALIPPGEPLLVESPTYPGVLAIARAASARPVPVPIDAKGLIIENLVDAFERTGARALYVQPAFQNPTGAVLDRDRRGALLQAAADAGAFVIEDDFARWLGHGSQVPRPLIADDQDGRVIYITSLTKVTAPSLRIGAVISRGAVTERIRALRMVDDMFVPRPAQEAALELVSSAGWDRHLRHLANALRQRSEALSAGLARHLPALPQVARPAGGMHRWVPLPPGFDDTEVAAAARRAGVIVTPGRAYYPAEPPGPHLRLTFAAASDVNSLDEGLRRLALALSDL